MREIKTLLLGGAGEGFTQNPLTFIFQFARITAELCHILLGEESKNYQLSQLELVLGKLFLYHNLAETDEAIA